MFTAVLFHLLGLRLFPFNLVSFLYEFSFFFNFQPAVKIENSLQYLK